jgi:hypothetical protein
VILPDDLPWSDDSRRAFVRIASNLERLKLWHPIDRSMTFVAATQAASYLTCCRIHGPRAEVTQETRQVARLLLSDMMYLDSVLEVRESDAGIDLDLLEICAPVEDAAA